MNNNELKHYDYLNHYDYLKHHGILGMKWGVRRYQNKDGTLTPAGKKRYNQNEQKIANKAKKKPSVTEMSDDELRQVINRLQMERQYSQLRPSSINKGKEYAQKVFKAGTTIAAVTSTTLTIYNNIDKIKDILKK